MSQSEQTKKALAILQAAIDREAAKKRDRYSHGYIAKPLGHDELNERLERDLEGKDG